MARLQPTRYGVASPNNIGISLTTAHSSIASTTYSLSCKVLAAFPYPLVRLYPFPCPRKFIRGIQQHLLPIYRESSSNLIHPCLPPLCTGLYSLGTRLSTPQPFSLQLLRCTVSLLLAIASEVPSTRVCSPIRAIVFLSRSVFFYR